MDSVGELVNGWIYWVGGRSIKIEWSKVFFDSTAEGIPVSIFDVLITFTWYLDRIAGDRKPNGSMVKNIPIYISNGEMVITGSVREDEVWLWKSAIRGTISPFVRTKKSQSAPTGPAVM